jgi:SGNH hydrolase-like domain, acetyltransferase AlgX
LLQGLRYAYWRYTSATFALNAAILGRFLALGRQRGFTLAVLFLPGPRDAWDDRLRSTFLRDWSLAHGVPYLDLTPTLRAGGADLYIAGDSHWSPAGHAAAARTIERFLVESGLWRRADPVVR